VDHGPALRALQDALRAGDDEVALRILEGLEARTADPELLELLAGFRRVLDGRALTRSLDLSLATEAAVGSERVRVLLVARHHTPDELTVRLPPATLKRTEARIDPAGFERRSGSSFTVEVFEELVLAEGGTVVLVLGEFDHGTAGSLAVRGSWRLAPRSGTITRAGEEYPCSTPVIRPTETLVRAPWLPAADVAPAELARYALEPEISMPALVERAVRIAPDRADEALRALAELEPDLPTARIRDLVPVLRWLAPARDLGGSPEHWRGALAALREVPVDAPPEAAAERDALDLPSARGGAVDR
jgi:hypothetical protein